MKIGSQAGKLTAISASNPDSIVVRGFDLCADLIGAVTFTDHVWLLVTGKLPSPGSAASSTPRWSQLPSTAWCLRWPRGA